MSISISGGSNTSQISRSQAAAAENLKRLASGKRINSAADDAAGIAVAAMLGADERSDAMATRNAMDGISMLQIADGGLSQQSDGVARLRELAMQSANGTLSQSDRDAIAGEANGIMAEIDRTAGSTEWNGRNLLSATNSATFQVGTEAGSDNQVNATINESTTSALGLGGLNLSTASGATTSMDAIDSALQDLSANRAGIGSTMNRLQSAYDTARTAFENAAASRGTIEDADVASEAADLAGNQVATQAGIAVLAQRRQMSSATALRLLG